MTFMPRSSRQPGADVIVKASGVGVHDELLEREVLSLRRPKTAVVFWDVDAPATLERIANTPDDPFRPLIPRYDLVFTYGGGDPVVERISRLGCPRMRPDLQRPRSADAPSGRARSAFRRHCWDFSAIGCPTVRRGCGSSSSSPRGAASGETFLLGGNGWDAGPARRPMCACWVMSTARTTTPSIARRAR